MLHLYGIVEERPSVGDALDGAPLASVAVRGLAAVVSEHDALEDEPTEEALWRHESVLEALMEDGPVLPVRFGVRFDDAESLRAELASRHEALRVALAHVRGRVELGVRLLEHAEEETTAPPDPSAGPGTRYLLERLERRRRAGRRAAPVRNELSRLAVAERARVLPRPHTLLAASYLVEASQVPAFRERTAALQRELPDVALVCTGPWPPYNFVDGDPGESV
jgi:gas vesicle protein GvpL/GvpF